MPAVAVVGNASITMFIVSVDAGQKPLLIVHTIVTFAPGVNAVNPVLCNAAFVIVAVPDDAVHKPVPVAGLFPAKVAVVKLQKR